MALNLQNTSDRARMAQQELLRQGLPLTQNNLKLFMAVAGTAIPPVLPAAAAQGVKIDTNESVAADVAMQDYILHDYANVLPGVVEPSWTPDNMINLISAGKSNAVRNVAVLAGVAFVAYLVFSKKRT